MNFLAIDDLLAVDEGEHIDPDSVISLEFQILKQVEASKKKWVVIIDTTGEPHFALDSDAFLRDALFKGKPVNPLRYCYRPIIVKPGYPENSSKKKNRYSLSGSDTGA